VSPKESRERFTRLVEQAAARGADIVCLPEGLTAAGNGLSYGQAAEAVPGPTTAFLGDLARRLHVWIVAGLYERSGTRLYNTAVLVGRDGVLAGRYRKMSLPDEEIEGGITPGTETPVFETDFGRVGLMICWDSSYPEVARALAASRAEVILMPIAGGVESLVQARAVGNQVRRGERLRLPQRDLRPAGGDRRRQGGPRRPGGRGGSRPPHPLALVGFWRAYRARRRPGAVSR
jgi:predicted amidohydrolase